MKPTVAGYSTKKPKRGWWEGGRIQKAEAECGSWARRRKDEEEEGRKILGEIINNTSY